MWDLGLNPKAVAVVCLALCSALARAQSEPSPDKETERLQELEKEHAKTLKELGELAGELSLAYKLGLDEALSAYEALWAGLKQGPEGSQQWSDFVDATTLKFSQDNSVPLNKELLKSLRTQFSSLARNAQDEDAALICHVNPDLKAQEERLRKTLTTVAAAAANFLDQHKEVLKSAGIKTDDLAARTQDALKLTKEAAGLFAKLKKVEVFTVTGAASWQNTGLKVKDGDRVRVLAIGMMNSGGLSPENLGPVGIDKWPTYRVAAKVNYGATIARVEGMEVEVYSTGASGWFEADRTGIVFLRPNSTGPMTGAYIAIIGIEKKQKGEDEDD